jgi:protein-L-isoaspartate(D-aspartate) O-methyltransferase
MKVEVRTAADRSNQEMVDRMIAQGALWSRPLMEAFRATPRHCFIDRVFQYQGKESDWREIITRDTDEDDLLGLVYSDQALSTHLSEDRPGKRVLPDSSSSQPSLMAQMLEDLKLRRGQRVLEIGAGTGYNAALMAHVVGPSLVTSIDVDLEVLSEAWDHLRKFPERGVQLQHGDGRQGFPERAPYDRIMVTAATPDLEPAWLAQLRSNGLLVAPLDLAPGLAFVVRGRATGGRFQGALMRAAYFMPLRSKEGEDGPEGDVPPRFLLEVRSIAAPWAGWFERKRPRGGWLGFSQSVAFFAWLRALTIYHHPAVKGESLFGISDGPEACWFGPDQWHVTSDTARDFAENLWREFLDLGAPRPNEFRLSCVQGTPPSRPDAFVRRGPRFGQCWELPALRDRPNWP